MVNQVPPVKNKDTKDPYIRFLNRFISNQRKEVHNDLLAFTTKIQ